MELCRPIWLHASPLTWLGSLSSCHNPRQQTQQSGTCGRGVHGDTEAWPDWRCGCSRDRCVLLRNEMERIRYVMIGEKRMSCRHKVWEKSLLFNLSWRYGWLKKFIPSVHGDLQIYPVIVWGALSGWDTLIKRFLTLRNSRRPLFFRHQVFQLKIQICANSMIEITLTMTLTKTKMKLVGKHWGPENDSRIYDLYPIFMNVLWSLITHLPAKTKQKMKVISNILHLMRVQFHV